MKIGRIVKRHIPAILAYCETQDMAELPRLQDARFSKQVFDINYPFCTPAAQIPAAESMRYWRDEYVVNGIALRVTSQWFNPPTSRSLPLLRDYLRTRGIAADDDADRLSGAIAPPAPRAARGRFKGNAIGNAQNHLVRNILSRLGDEQFGAEDWQAVIADFGHGCAYCGAGGELVMDHVIAINKQSLGEHRIGNLVPACRPCNTRKAEQDFEVFLSHDLPRTQAIKAHMAKHGYAPIGENDRLRQIIELAHQDLRHLADRYVTIINTLMSDEDIAASPMLASPLRRDPEDSPAARPDG